MKLNYASINNDYNIYNKYSLIPNIIEHADIQFVNNELKNMNVKTIIIKPLIPESYFGVKRINENNQKLWYLGHIDIFDTKGDNIVTSAEFPDNNLTIELIDSNSHNYLKKSSISEEMSNYSSVTNLIRSKTESQIKYNGDKVNNDYFNAAIKYNSILKINIPDDIDVSAIILTPYLDGSYWEQIMDLKVELYDFNWSLHTEYNSKVHFFPTPIYKTVTPYYSKDKTYDGPGSNYGPYAFILLNKDSDENSVNTLLLHHLFENSNLSEIKDSNDSLRIILKKVTIKDIPDEEESIKNIKGSWRSNFMIFSDGNNTLNDEQSKMMILWFKTLAWLKRPKSDNYYNQVHPKFNDIDDNDIYNHINYNFDKLYNSSLPENNSLPKDYKHQIFIFKNLQIDSYVDFMESYSGSNIVNENDNLLANIIKNENVNIIDDLKENPISYCKFLNIFQSNFDPCLIDNEDKQDKKSVEDISESLSSFFNKDLEQNEPELINEDGNLNEDNKDKKTSGDIFDLFDLDKDNKLNKYEAKLLLATVTKRPIKVIADYLLKVNFLGVNIENISKGPFTTAYDKLDILPDKQYETLAPTIRFFEDEKYKKLNLQIVKTWEDIFNELLDKDKNGILDKYEAKLFLATIVGKNVSEISDRELSSNFLGINLENVNLLSFSSACEKLTNARGEKQSSTDVYNLIEANINSYHDEVIQKNTEVGKTWENIFDELFDFSSKDAILDIYEAKLFLASAYNKPIKDINDSLIENVETNILNTNLNNISKKQFVEICKKLRGADGNLLDSTSMYFKLEPNVKRYHDRNLRKELTLKSWEDVFKLFDLDGNDLLDKYEGKLVLSTVFQKSINEVQDSMLKDNFLKVDLENISKDDFINACKNLDSSPTISYNIFEPRIKIYHDPDIQNKMLSPLSVENIKIIINKFKININLFYIIIILYIPIAMIIAAIHGKGNNLK